MEEENQLEFSGAGAVAGFSLPLGMTPPNFEKPKKKRKKKLKSLVSESVELLSELFEMTNY
jgi:hypothetical protein